MLNDGTSARYISVPEQRDPEHWDHGFLLPMSTQKCLDLRSVATDAKLPRDDSTKKTCSPRFILEVVRVPLYVPCACPYPHFRGAS